MHAAAGETPMQGLIKRIMAGGDMRTVFGGWNPFQRCDVPPEGCKRLHRLDHKNVLYMFFSVLERFLSMKLVGSGPLHEAGSQAIAPDPKRSQLSLG